jgi:WD40 repeat protein/tRNA A-37 threonylcarbamoyl transferase component Bud32
MRDREGVDCDDVMLLVAVGEGRTLSGAEEHQFQDHVAGCETCRAVTVETADDRLRWVARIPEDALDDPDLLVLPTVDPIVFAKGEELAHGGMGRITRARDRRLGRDVAIKEVLAPYLRARFEREAMITARLQHPAIVPVYEAGTWPDGSAFYTMRLVSGGTLADAIARTKTLEDRLALLPHVLALTEALGYAHSRRVVHRDLKPANVLVGEFGETVVIDWGLAKDLDRRVSETAAEPGAGPGSPDASDLTRAGSVVGTPCFIAPEQAEGLEIDERADVYALGAILYNLLAGQPPYWDNTEHSAERLVEAARAVPPTPIAQLAPRVPPDLRAIVERAMARDRAARYPTAKELAEELRRFEAGQLLGSRQYTTRELIVRWLRRHRAVIAVAAVAVAVLAIGGAISLAEIFARQRETEQALTASRRASKVAEDANAANRVALAEARLERGRQLLIDGDPGQAAPYLDAALGVLPRDAVALRLAAIALRDVDRRIGGVAGTAAAFRHDGRELAIGHADGSVDVADPARPAVAHRLLSVGKRVVALAYSPDDHRLAVASEAGAYVRDARSGELIRVQSEAATEVVFAGSDRLAIASAGAVRVVTFDGKPAAEAGVQKPHGLAVSRDGTCVAALTADGATVWPTADPRHGVDHKARDKVWYAVACRDGALITGGQDGVRRWTAAQRDTTLWAEPVTQLSWIDGDDLLAGGSVIHTRTGAVQPIGPWSSDLSAAIGDSHVITGDADHRLRIWDLRRTADPVAVLDAAEEPHLLVVDDTGHHAFSRGDTEASLIELWDVRPAARIAPVTVRGSHVEDGIDNLFADRRGLIAVQVGAGVQLWAGAAGPPRKLPGDLQGTLLGFRPRDGQLVVAAPSGALNLHAGSEARPAETIRCPDDDPPEHIWHVAFSATGTAMAIACERSVWLRDLDGGPWHRVEGAGQSLEIASLAIDGRRRIAVGYNDGHLELWNVPPDPGAAAPDPGAAAAVPAHTRPWQRYTTRAHDRLVAALELRDDMLSSIGWDGVMRRWAFSAGAPGGGVIKHLVNAAISPNGAWIATVSTAPVVSLWDASRDRLIQQIPLADRPVRVAFLDDARVVVASVNGELEVIDLSVPMRDAAEVHALVGSSRWQLVGGKAVERRDEPSEALH